MHETQRKSCISTTSSFPPTRICTGDLPKVISISVTSVVCGHMFASASLLCKRVWYRKELLYNNLWNYPTSYLLLFVVIALPVVVLPLVLVFSYRPSRFCRRSCSWCLLYADFSLNPSRRYTATGNFLNLTNSRYQHQIRHVSDGIWQLDILG